MVRTLSIRLVKFEDGERFPFLVDSSTGLPLFNPTTYLLLRSRARSKAVNTLKAELVALQALYLWGDSANIDIDGRGESGELLSPNEVDDLVATLKRPVSEIREAAPPKPARGRGKVVQLARVAAKVKGSVNVVAPNTSAFRARVITDYMKWLSTPRRRSLPPTSTERAAIKESIEALENELKGLLPFKNGKKGDLDGREGIADEARDRLFSVIDPNSPENPWKRTAARERNALIVRLLYHLGMRKGELLGVKISDFDWRKNTLRITRHPDDKEDPRRNAPQTKTRARTLALGAGLIKQVETYVLGARRSTETAQKHGYLLVALDGKPMSQSALDRLFKDLRKRVPDLPQDLTAHVLRHSWNDNFSAIMDQRGVDARIEEKLRCEQMGWADGSQMAIRYTKRHTRERTHAVSIELQGNLMAVDEDTKQ